MMEIGDELYHFVSNLCVVCLGSDEPSECQFSHSFINLYNTTGSGNGYTMSVLQTANTHYENLGGDVICILHSR